eukprot:g2828.t1
MVTSRPSSVRVDHNCARLVLSDISQSRERDNPLGIQDMRMVQMNEVVRNTERIVLGATGFQIRDSDDSDDSGPTRCCYKSGGPPLKSFVFKPAHDTEERLTRYAEQVTKALDEVQKQFAGLSLHNRVAIIAPDEHFAETFRPVLERHIGSRFALIDAVKASRTVPGAKGPKRVPERKNEWLVFDSIDNFNGLERLIVIAVDLDRAIDNGEGSSTLETRSRLYRAITRAQLMAAVVNEIIVGGWLEFLTRVQLSKGRFDAARAQTECRNDAAQEVCGGGGEELGERVEGKRLAQANAHEVKAARMQRQQGLSEEEKTEEETEEKVADVAKERARQSVWDTSGNDRFASSGILAFMPFAFVEPTWANVTGSHFVAKGGVLEKKEGGKDYTWDSGASSVQQIERRDGVEQGVVWKASRNDKNFIIGLSHEWTGTRQSDKDFGLECGYGGYLFIYEKGSKAKGPGVSYSFGTYAAGDELEVRVTADAVSYHHNGRLLHTSKQAPEWFPLVADCSFYHAGAKAEGVRLRL